MHRSLMGRLQRIRAIFARRNDRRSGGDSQSWLPDDLAECIFDGAWVNPHGVAASEPCAGHVAIVRGVRIAPDWDGAYRQYLIFARWPDRMFLASSFRKLTPRADAADAADAAFIDGLKLRRIAAPSPTLPIVARLKRMFS